MALVPERSPARGAACDEEGLVLGAGGKDEEPPRTLPGTVLGEACRADLGAVGGCPAAGGDLSVGVPVGRVEAGQVKGGAVEGGEGRAYTSHVGRRGREQRAASVCPAHEAFDFRQGSCERNALLLDPAVARVLGVQQTQVHLELVGSEVVDHSRCARHEVTSVLVVGRGTSRQFSATRGSG